MERRSALLLSLCLSLPIACGPKRIAREAIPDKDRVEAFKLVGVGDQLLRDGKDHLALVKYTEASILHPFHESIFNKLAVAYSRLQRYPEAKKAVERSIGLNPRYPYAYNTRGIIAMALHDTKAAIRSFRRALQTLGQPEDQRDLVWAANFHLNLGYAYVQQHKYERGIDAYRRAISLYPEILEQEDSIRLRFSSPSTTDPEVQFMYAKLFAALGDKKQALLYLDRALSAGFKDLKKLTREEAFRSLLRDEDFIALIERYGHTATVFGVGS